MSTRTKKILKGVSLFTGVAAAILIAGAVFIFYYVNSDRFRDLLLEKINRSIAGELSIGGHKISIRSGRVVCKKVAFRDEFSNTLILLDTLTVNLAYLPLLNRTILLESMVLRHPDVRLRVDQDGVLDLVRALQPASQKQRAEEPRPAGTPVNVVAQSLLVEGGAFRFEAPANRFGVEAAGIRLQAKGDLVKKAAGAALHVDRTRLFLGGKDLEIRPVVVYGELAGDRLETLRVEAGTDFADIRMEGDVSRVFHDPEVNLRLVFDVLPAGLAEIVPLPADISGRLAGVLTARGNWKNPGAALQLSYGGGRIAGYPVKGMDAGFLLENRKIALKNLNITADSGKISLEGFADLREVLPAELEWARIQPDKLAYSIRARLKDIDIHSFGRGAGRFQGTLSSSLTIEGKGVDPESLSAFATAEALVSEWIAPGMQRSTDVQLALSGELNALKASFSKISIMGCCGLTH
ncbi:MAG: hypothetical protein P8Y38_02385 [Deltaproteobacteria bacterium]